LVAIAVRRLAVYMNVTRHRLARLCRNLSAAWVRQTRAVSFC
jgi:hypothetical protein